MKMLHKGLICVDDEEQILKALRRCLRATGYELLTTTDPDEAIVWVGEGRAQIVMSDYRMKNSTGLDLLERVQAMDPRPIRVILSGYADQETVTRALEQGVVYNYLLKPWETPALRAKVEEYFERYAQLYGGEGGK